MLIVKIDEISAVLGQFRVEISSPTAQSGRTALEPPQTPPLAALSFRAVSVQFQSSTHNLGNYR